MWLPLVIVSLALMGPLYGGSYEQTDAIFKDFLNSSIYNTDVIPMSNQSTAIEVLVHFRLVSIVAVDDITESFVCNSFLTFWWTDQRIQWDPADYGGKTLIHPHPTKIWRPRIILLNTLNDRDPFGDNASPLAVQANGTVIWSPGSLFTTSCSLNMLKYPFDEQECDIEMTANGLITSELLFVKGSWPLTMCSINGAWDLREITIDTVPTKSRGLEYPRLNVKIRIKRRPTFYVLTIILPFVFLSFLNLLVFTIPQESGEKIGYGIGVLLTLSLFFSIIGDMLPRTSETVPYVIIYLFLLYVISTLVVVETIAICYIYHVKETGDGLGKIRNQNKNIFFKPSRFQNVVETMSINFPMNPDAKEEGQKKQYLSSELENRLTCTNKMEARHDDGSQNVDKASRIGHDKPKCVVNFASGLVFILLWISVTLWFFNSVVR